MAERVAWLYQLNAIYVNSLMYATPSIPPEIQTQLDPLNKKMLTQLANPAKRRQISCLGILPVLAHYYDANLPLEMRIAWA